MKKILICSYSLFISLNYFSQNFGYFGKKNILDFDLACYTPFLRKYFDEQGVYYVSTANGLKKKGDNIEASFSFNYSRNISRKADFGIEIGYQRIDVGNEQTFSNSIYDTDGNTFKQVYFGALENFKFNHIYMIPKIELRVKNGIFGLGISHQFGCGIGFSRFVNKKYNFDFKKNGSGVQLSEEEKNDFRTNMYDFSNTDFTNFIFMYALNYRKPISEKLMLNYGLKYSLNVGFKSITKYNYNPKYFIDTYEIQELIRADKYFNIIQFKLGLSYVF